MPVRVIERKGWIAVSPPYRGIMAYNPLDQWVAVMSREQRSNREAKKPAATTMKERRAAKKLKKESEKARRD